MGKLSRIRNQSRRRRRLRLCTRPRPRLRELHVSLLGARARGPAFKASRSRVRASARGLAGSRSRSRARARGLALVGARSLARAREQLGPGGSKSADPGACGGILGVLGFEAMLYLGTLLRQMISKGVGPFKFLLFLKQKARHETQYVP